MKSLPALAAAMTQTCIAVGVYFVAKATLEHFPPLALAMVRFLGSSILLGLLVFLLVKGVRAKGRDFAAILGLGVLGISLNQGLFLVGIAESTPARAALMYALSPLAVMGIATFRGLEKLSMLRTIGIVVALGGVILILSERGGLEGSTLRGDLFLLAAVVAWSFYTALAKRLLQTYGALQVTGLAMIGGTLAFAPVGVPVAATADLTAIPAVAWWGAVYLIVGMSVIGYFLWYFAIARLQPSRVAVFMNLQPPLTVTVAWLWFGETISARFLIGAAFVLAGVWSAQFTRRKTADG